MGRIPLTPQTFEIVSTTSLEAYRSILATLASGRPEMSRRVQRAIPKSKPTPYTGWNKHHLRLQIWDAINQAGLARTYTSAAGYRETIIPYTALGIQRPGNLPGFKFYGTHGEVQTIPYARKTYYETIYRKLFNTLQNIDWAQVCRAQLVDENMIRFIAINDFHLDPNQVFRWTYRRLCERLDQVSAERRRTLKTLAEEAAQVAPTIILQPGSP